MARASQQGKKPLCDRVHRMSSTATQTPGGWPPMNSLWEGDTPDAVEREANFFFCRECPSCATKGKLALRLQLCFSSSLPDFDC